MDTSQMHKIEDYFELVLILFLLGLFFLLIQPYLLSLFLAASVVFILYPFYERLVKRTKKEGISALFVMTLVLFLLLIPLYLITFTLVEQSESLLGSGKSAIQNINLDQCTYEFCRTIENNVRFIDVSFEGVMKRFGSQISSSYSSLFESIASFFINFFIFLLAFFFFLKDGKKFLAYVRKIVPMKNSYKDALFLRFRQVSMAVFGNNLLTAFIQGTLVGIGFWIFGVDNALFWGLVASLVSLVPVLGPALVWFPVVVYLFLTQDYWNAIGLLFYGVIVVAFSDNITRPFLLEKSIEVHPLLIMLSIFGGMELFGFFMGIFLGPIIISLLISVLHLYHINFR
jgi:predicted PurR-regulated permease PerM